MSTSAALSAANENYFSSSETVLTLFLFGTGLLLFLAGRALVSFLAEPRTPAGTSPLASPNFAAIGTGAALTLLLTWMLRVVDGYGFWPMIACLCAVVLAAIILQPGFRDLVFRPWRHAGFMLLVYALLVIVFLVLLRPYEYPVKETSMYLSQGFDLFIPGHDPSELPQYGAKLFVPVFYSAHAVLAVFGLFSYPDHFFYFASGEYLLNAFLGMTIPIGAYLLFRRSLPWWAALAAAILFCGTILNWKIWSLRGESLGWIGGFGFLIVQADVQAYVRRNGVDRLAFGAATLMAVLYFTLWMTHGVTALVATLMSAGMAASFAWDMFKQRKSRPLGPSLALGGFVAVLILGLNLAFIATYSRSSDLIEGNARPPAGDSDAAIEYDNAYVNLPLETDVPKVLAAPPYVPLHQMLEISALLPAANLFHPGIMRFAVRDFPALALKNLKQMSRQERLAYGILFALCCLVYLRYPSRQGRRDLSLFLAAAGVYLVLIALALHLDMKSVAVFPVAAIRRTFPYQAFFYWTIVALALGNVIALLASAVRRSAVQRSRTASGTEQHSRTASGTELDGRSVGSLTLRELATLFARITCRGTTNLLARLPLPQPPAAPIPVRDRRRPWEDLRSKTVVELDRGELVTLLAVLPQRWLATARVSTRTAWQTAQVSTRNAWKNADWRKIQLSSGFSWERVAVACLIPAWLFYAINVDNRRPVSLAWIVQRIELCLQNDCSGNSTPPLEVSLRPLFEAISAVRDNTQVGDWVYSNVSSEHQFWFLTSGRYTFLDGASIFQLYSALKSAARRMAAFAKFSEAADSQYVAGHPFKLIMLYKLTDCRPVVCYGNRQVPTNLAAFADSSKFEKIMENDYYVVYRRRSPQTTAAGDGLEETRDPAASSTH